jgi:hypothetical protein
MVQNGSLIETYAVLNASEDNGIMETPAQAMGLNNTIVEGVIE